MRRTPSRVSKTARLSSTTGTKSIRVVDNTARDTRKKDLTEPLVYVPSKLQSRYRDWTYVAEGSFGQLYRVWDAQADHMVAIKRLIKTKTDANEVKVEIAGLQQAKRAAGGACSQFVVCYEDLLEDGDSYFLIMEWLGDYMPLSSYIATTKGNQSLADTMAIANNLILGLAFIHEIGMAHKDIKPDNIMVSRKALLTGSKFDASIKYIDFGLSCIEKACNKRSVNSGTPSYFAPEQIYDSVTPSLIVHQKADIWSLGISITRLYMGTDLYNVLKVMYGEQAIGSKWKEAYAAKVFSGVRIPSIVLTRPIETVAPASSSSASSSPLAAAKFSPGQASNNIEDEKTAILMTGGPRSRSSNNRRRSRSKSRSRKSAKKKSSKTTSVKKSSKAVETKETKEAKQTGVITVPIFLMDAQRNKSMPVCLVRPLAQMLVIQPLAARSLTLIRCRETA